MYKWPYLMFEPHDVKERVTRFPINGEVVEIVRHDDTTGWGGGGHSSGVFCSNRVYILYYLVQLRVDISTE